MMMMFITEYNPSVCTQVLPMMRQVMGQLQTFAQQQQQQQQHRQQQQAPDSDIFMETNPSESSPTRKRVKARKAQ